MQEYEDEIRKKDIEVITGDGIVRGDTTEFINVEIMSSTRIRYLADVGDNPLGRRTRYYK